VTQLTDIPRNEGRISSVLFEGSSRRFETFAPLPSNVDATEAALHFANGVSPFVALIGPSGWGKTHLLEGAIERSAVFFADRTRVMCTASHWLHDGPGRDMADVLALDDVQDALSRTRSRIQLRLGLERRFRAQRPTLLAFTGDRPQRQLLNFLPYFREWRVALLEGPTLSERHHLLQRLARLEGLCLDNNLICLIAQRMKGNGRTLQGALKRLRLYGADWTGPRATLRAAGLLDPFFSDDSGWDLSERILLAVDVVVPKFPGFDAAEVAMYVMLRDAALSEVEIATSFGTKPAHVYTAACRLRAQAESNPHIRRCLAEVVDAVVQGLSSD